MARAPTASNNARGRRLIAGLCASGVVLLYGGRDHSDPYFRVVFQRNLRGLLPVAALKTRLNWEMLPESAQKCDFGNTRLCLFQHFPGFHDAD